MKKGKLLMNNVENKFRSWNHVNTEKGVFFNHELDTADQLQKSESDMNKIIARYDKSGYMPEGKGEGAYADVTGLQELEFDEQILKSREVQETLVREKSEKLAAQKQAEIDEVENMRQKLSEYEAAEKIKSTEN